MGYYWLSFKAHVMSYSVLLGILLNIDKDEK